MYSAANRPSTAFPDNGTRIVLKPGSDAYSETSKRKQLASVHETVHTKELFNKPIDSKSQDESFSYILFSSFRNTF